MHKNFPHFEKLLKAARTLPELNAALQSQLAKLQITTFSFTYYSYYLNALNKLKYDFSSANFDSWHKHYLEQNYAEIDTTLEKTYQNALPTFWSLKQQLAEAKSPKEKQMRLDSIEFGAEKGLLIPIHGPQEDFATFLIVQMRGECCLDNWQELQYELFLTGYYYYSYLQAILLKCQASTEKNPLTQREMQCLMLTSQQYSVEKIATKLNITERTVNYHIQRLNKKLGTKNKNQSVTKAIQKGLIH
ncbi:N/A [soil metagenome]